MEERYRPHYRKIWETKCARFNAHSRFQGLGARASKAVIILTLAVLAIAAFKAGSFLGTSSDAQKAGDIALVLFSMSLLALELYIKGQRYEEKAAQFHRSGKLISRVYDKFVFAVNRPVVDDFEIEQIISEYHNAIDSHGVNHDYVDWQIVVAHNSREYGYRAFSSLLFRIYVEFMFYWKGGGLYIFFSAASLFWAMYFIWGWVSG